MDLLGAMRIFVRVAEARSFTGIAREMGIGQPAVSKQIGALEAHLGTRLLSRTTRRLTLTEDGRSFYEQSRHALEAVAEAEAAVGRKRLAPSGLVRIGSPVAFGRLHLAPRMRGLLDRYPGLRIELVMSDGFVDLVEHGLDLAVRIGELTDGALVARRLGTTARVTVGAAEYFDRAGEPREPADLAMHNCIVYTQLATGDEWHFSGPSGPVRVRVSGNYLANNSEAIREGVLAGIGIAVTPLWLFGDEIARGLVRVVLRDHEPKALPIHAVHPTSRFVPARLRAVIDYLVDEFARDPMLSGQPLAALRQAS